MNPIQIIGKYYTPESDAYKILISHSRSVANKALSIAENMHDDRIDLIFIEEAAMLHDIGIYLCNAPGIRCYGEAPYICHGTLGAEILRKEGLHRHALVAERHTGVGISKEMIRENTLPLPYRDLKPISIEEKIICFADKFYSKTRLEYTKSIEEVRHSLLKHGASSIDQFDTWVKEFLDIPMR